MFWTAVWFVVNMAFVASVILFLFMHRAVGEAKLQGADAGRQQNLKRRRQMAGILSVIMFVLMVTSFLINMKLNG